MKKKILVLVLSAVMLVSTLAGCGNQGAAADTGAQPETKEAAGTSETAGTNETAETSETGEAAKEKYVIGMSQCNLGEPWRVAMNDQIKEAAAQYPEFEIIFSDAAQDNSKQIADIENFIQQGVDLIITSPNEATPLTNVVKKAYESGIPVILLDRKIDGDTYTQFIGADNVEIGRQCGEYVATTLLKDGGKICEIKGLEGTSGGIDRDNGFREGIKVNPKVEIVAANNADWLREKAITVAEEMLQTQNEIDLFFALNDPMAEGAYIAAKNAGREGEILFVGVDGLPTPDGGIKSVMEGRLSMSMVYPTGGAEAIQSAYQLLVEGKELEKEITLQSEVIIPENAADIYAKYGGK